MPSVHADISGNWYGMMVHHPSWGMVHVSFTAENGSFNGKWDFPKLSRGGAKTGEFKAVRFANWLNIRILTEPLLDVQCQLTLVKENRQSMITGIIPFETADFPFATITLFRQQLGEGEMDGICPLREFHQPRVKSKK